jgi:hypothetical protein
VPAAGSIRRALEGAIIRSFFVGALARWMFCRFLLFFTFAGDVLPLPVELMLIWRFAKWLEKARDGAIEDPHPDRLIFVQFSLGERCGVT